MLAFSTQVAGVLDPLVEFIQGKAKAGAEEAIPEIEQKVKDAAKQVIMPVIALTVGSLLISLIALREARRARTKSLSGARRR